MRIGDRIAVMSQGGHVEQFATPAELLGKPANAVRGRLRRRRPRAQAAGGHRHRRRRPRAAAGGARRRRAGRRPGRAGARGRPLGRRPRRRRARCTAGCPASGAAGAGTVGSAARRMEAWVPVDATLKTAFADDAAAGGRLGRGARRRPLPRRAHPGVAARGAAPLGRGRRARDRRARGGPCRLSRAQAWVAGVPGRPCRRAGGHPADGLQPERGDDQRRRRRPTPTTAVTVSPAAAAEPAHRGPDVQQHADPQAGEDRRRRRRWPGRGRPARATSIGSTGRTGAASPAGRHRGRAAPRRASRSASSRVRSVRAPSASATPSTAERQRQPPVQRRQRAVEAAHQQPGGDGEPEREDGEVARRRTRPHCRCSQRTTAATSSGGSAATRSATRPWPGSSAAGSRAATARARRPARAPAGAAASAPGRRRRTGAPSSPVTVTTSTSSVRGPQRTSRVRPAACSSSCARASQPAASRGAADDGDRVQVRRLLDRPPRRGLVQRRAGDQAVVRERGERRRGASPARSPRLAPSDSTARVMPAPGGSSPRRRRTARPSRPRACAR